ncbi:MAG: transcription termination/antitermination protein NusG [Planctomycetaceae bacterium]|jgi:transcriptional antiterminator NusG|nr:transcription termination/antitermination protein NusG [Planctomycetaceae bacterium]
MLESELEKGNDDKMESRLEESIETDAAVEVSESIKPTEKKPTKGRKTKKTSPAKGKTKEKENTDDETTTKTETPQGKDWYILKVQVNREDAVKKNLENRAKIAGLDEYFGDILVPTEKVTEIRNEKKRIVKRKLYPGYVMIYMEINDDTWYLVRETPGIGDFTGAVGKPTPMLPHEVQRMLSAEKEDPAESPKLKVGYSIGDQIKIKEGSFENLDGIVDAIDYTSGRVTVIINLFGRSTPVELEYWQIEQNSG